MTAVGGIGNATAIAAAANATAAEGKLSGRGESTRI